MRYASVFTENIDSIGFVIYDEMIIQTTIEENIDISHRVKTLMDLHDIYVSIEVIKPDMKVREFKNWVSDYTENLHVINMWNPRKLDDYVLSDTDVYSKERMIESAPKKPFWCSEISANSTLSINSLSKVRYDQGKTKPVDFILPRIISDEWGIDFKGYKLTPMDRVILGTFYTYLMAKR